MKRFLAIPIVLFAVLGTAWPVAGADNVMLDEIVIKGEMEAPNQESLTIREVRESPAKDIGEALKQVEGVDIVRKGAIANDVVLRGFQRDNINVLVDGARIHGACPSRMDPPAFHFDFAEVEQVRIIKGPYDIENPGSLGGVVDIQSKRPSKGFGGDLNLTYGSYDAVNGSAAISYGTDRFDGLLGYAYKRSDVPESGDGKLITDVYPATSPNRYRLDTIDSKAYEINTGWAKFGINPTENSRSEISYSYQDAEHVLYPYLKMDADYDKTHLLNWTYQIDKVSPLVRELKMQAYWDRVSHLMDDRLRQSSVGKARGFSMQTDAETRVYGAKLQGSLTAGPGVLKCGVDYYNRNWDTENLRAMFTAAKPFTPVNMIPDVFVDNVGMFTEYGLPLTEQVSLKAGIRGDLTWVEAEKNNTLTVADDSADFEEVSANLQVTYKPVKELELYLGLGRGARTPDPEELFIDVPAMAPAVTWRGNPDLKPTINHEADLGMKYATDRYYINASLFYSYLTDYVNFYQASSTLKSYQNIDASIWGAELGGQVALPYDLFLKGSLSFTEGENKDSDRPLSEIPPLKGMVAIRYDNGTFFAEAAENMAGEQDRVDSALSEQSTPGWASTDLKVGYEYKALTVYGGVYNLFDKQYYSHLSYQRDPFGSGVKVPENGRNFYVTVVYKF
ncbi:MAG: TonB-dependent receptor [Desulfuromonas sp.]|nr:TonB-dependent receptor [Desulfuromonas sp.]